MNKYAVISVLESQAKTYSLANLPLHVTLLGIFTSDSNIESLATMLDSGAKGQAAVITKVIGRKNFGDERNELMVSELDKTPELARLQEALILAFGKQLETMDKNFQPKTYRPHVTDQNTRIAPSDKPVIIDNLTLVEVTENSAIERHRLNLA